MLQCSALFRKTLVSSFCVIFFCPCDKDYHKQEVIFHLTCIY